MSNYTRMYNKFEYHEEDCLFFQGRKNIETHGCDRDVCCCEDIHADAIVNGRTKRVRGWFRFDE